MPKNKKLAHLDAFAFGSSLLKRPFTSKV